MARYDTARVADTTEETAPDGSRVRPLLSVESGSMAQFELGPGRVSRGVRHRSVSEIWLVVSGRGLMWRRQNQTQSVVELTLGTCVSIPVGTAFQFRCDGDGPLRIAAVTMPPWPGGEEAEFVSGEW